MNPKTEVITFKVDAALAEAMRSMPNRSDFLRAAVLAALENTCPLCNGTGFLTPRQMEHWQEFTRTHSLEECSDCHEYHLVCEADSAEYKKSTKTASQCCCPEHHKSRRTSTRKKKSS